MLGKLIISIGMDQILFQTAKYSAGTVINKHSDMEYIMSKKDSHHVVPNPDGGWDVKRSGSQRASSHSDRKQDAVDAGREISINQGTEFFIHGKDGEIQSRDSHGNDPFPPKG